jgi:hypothetical protein
MYRHDEGMMEEGGLRAAPLERKAREFYLLRERESKGRL